MRRESGGQEADEKGMHSKLSIKYCGRLAKQEMKGPLQDL